MSSWQPWHLFVVGGVLVTVGMVLPFLMVMRLIPTTFFLSFFSYGASVVGLLLGIIGSAMYVARRRREDR